MNENQLDILLVEDHPDTAHVMARLFRSIGHRVYVAGTRAAALSAADQREFDLVLCDIGMPDGDGVDLQEPGPFYVPRTSKD